METEVKNVKVKKSSYCEVCDAIVSSLYHHNRTLKHQNKVNPPEVFVYHDLPSLEDKCKLKIINQINSGIKIRVGRPCISDEERRLKYLIAHPNKRGRPKTGSVKVDTTEYEKLLQTIQGN